MLITIRVPKETTKLQYIIENPEDGYDITKTIQMGDIVAVCEETPNVHMDQNCIGKAVATLRGSVDE